MNNAVNKVASSDSVAIRAAAVNTIVITSDYLGWLPENDLIKLSKVTVILLGVSLILIRLVKLRREMYLLKKDKVAYLEAKRTYLNTTKEQRAQENTAEKTD